MASPSGANSRGSRLDSWKEIAAYLNRDVRTVQRWEKTANLPVRRLQNPGLRAVFAYTADLDEWLRGQQPEQAPVANPKPTRFLAIGAIAVLVILVTGFLAFRRSGPATFGPFTARPITSDPGSERDPSISPDGKLLLYATVAPDSRSRILVRPLTGGEPRTLTDTDERESSPVWSPDGSKIAFLRGNPAGKATLWVMSSGGGSERKIADIRPYPLRRTLMIGHLLAWHPNGRLIFPDRPTDDKGTLFSLDIETGRREALTSPDPATFDVEPSLSSDGRTLLFNRVRGEYVSDVFVQPFDRPAAARKLPRAGNWNGTPRLLEDRGEVLVSAGSLPRLALWRVPFDGSSAPVSLGIIADSAVQSAVDRRSGRIVSRTYRAQADVVRYRLDIPASKEEPFLESTFIERSASYSPDGSSVAFISDRTGRRQLWVSDADGHNPTEWKQDFEADLPFPAWSPDGSKILFIGVSPAGNSQLYTVDRATRSATRLTNDSRDYNHGAWSSDGKYIYSGASENSVYGIYRLPSGGGPAERVVSDYRYVVGLEPSGKGMYATRTVKRDQAEVAYVDLVSGKRSVIASVGLADDTWTSREGLYYLDTNGVLSLRSHSGVVKALHKFAERPGRGLSVSPDGKFVLTARLLPLISDLLLLEPAK